MITLQINIIRYMKLDFFKKTFVSGKKKKRKKKKEKVVR